MSTHMLDNIAVADLGTGKRHPVVAEIALKPEIRHHRRHDSAALESAPAVPGLGDQRHQLIAIDPLTALVGHDPPAGIAVECNADIGAYLAHPLAHRFGRGRATFLVDIEPVGLAAD